MGAPFDFTKIRKDRTKRLGLRGGFSDPITWIDTGNFALNKMISGHFDRGIPLGAVTVFAGETGCLPAYAKVRIRITQQAWTDEIQVTVGELRALYHATDVKLQIDTPDGYQNLSAWWDKGILPMMQIATANGCLTCCAANHLLQLASGEWRAADQLQLGDLVQTRSGHSAVNASIAIAAVECFDFTVDHPNHRYWGDDFASHNSGKSYIVSGNIVRDALAKDIHVIVLDSEDALKETWMRNLGVDPDHPKLAKEVVSTVDDIAECIKDYTTHYIESNKMLPREQQTKVLFVVDSLGLIQTQAEIDQFDRSELKGDKGIKAKMLKMLVANCIRLFAGYEIGLVATNHTYKSQDMYNPADVISGGSGFFFASSIIVSMNKRKLKEDAAGNKITEVAGIRAKIKCEKTRYAKPFEEVEVLIPYAKGMDKFSGLFDLFEKTVFCKDGNRYRYVSADGTEHKLFRKHMTQEFLQMVMDEWKDDRVASGTIEEHSEQEGEATDVE